MNELKEAFQKQLEGPEEVHSFEYTEIPSEDAHEIFIGNNCVHITGKRLTEILARGTLDNWVQARLQDMRRGRDSGGHATPPLFYRREMLEYVNGALREILQAALGEVIYENVSLRIMERVEKEFTPLKQATRRSNGMILLQNKLFADHIVHCISPKKVMYPTKAPAVANA